MNAKMQGVIGVDHMPLIADIHKAVQEANRRADTAWDDLHYEWRLVDGSGDPVAEGDYGEYPRFDIDRFNIDRFNNEEIF